MGTRREGGISHAGKAVEERFFELVDARAAPRAAAGDAVVNGTPVEIKHASSDTLNQVRAVKFIPLVCFDARTSTWYVVPAHQVVRLVAQKKRGQHTENPFESATLSVRALGAFAVADDASLQGAVAVAIEADAGYPELRRAMERILEQSSALARESRLAVNAVLGALGLRDDPA